MVAYLITASAAALGRTWRADEGFGRKLAMDMPQVHLDQYSATSPIPTLSRPDTRARRGRERWRRKQSQDQRIDQFFSGPGARADHWRFLVDAAKAWSDGSGNRKFDDLLSARSDGGISRISRPSPDGSPEGSCGLRRCFGDYSQRATLESLMTKSFRQHAVIGIFMTMASMLRVTDLLPPSS